MSKPEMNCKGFIAEIFESKDMGNCSNNGISESCKEVTIVSDEDELQIFETYPKDQLNRPLVVIKKRIIGGEEYVHAEPIYDPEGVGWMMGGSFIWSSDSRFRRLISQYPVPLHDRQETSQQYEEMSI